MANISKMGALDATSFIFENAANQEEQLFNAIKAQFNKEFIPADIQTEKMKSGGLFLGTKEVVISIVRQGFPRFYIVSRTVGHYLYVAIINTNVQQEGMVHDWFIAVTIDSYYQACVSCLQNALYNLGFKEYEGRFKGVSQGDNKSQK